MERVKDRGRTDRHGWGGAAAHQEPRLQEAAQEGQAAVQKEGELGTQVLKFCEQQEIPLDGRHSGQIGVVGAAQRGRTGLLAKRGGFEQVPAFR
jgi:hypothetical protein